LAGTDTWENTFAGLFSERCSVCHGQAVSGGLLLDSYANALKGGSRGAGVVPFDAQNSQIVLVQQAGAHPGQLTPQELVALIAWIQAGAPER
jgi:mono/diheme cytochrome c family protein